MSEPKNTEPASQRRHRAFFGRVSGKRLHNAQRALVDTLLPELEIGIPPDRALDIAECFPDSAKNHIMEIGYGGGEHLARLASENPQTAFVGCEVFTGGIGKILQKIETEKLSNIRLFTSDAYLLLQALPDACLEGVYLLYPDPWPKSRHHKRRFVSPTTLDALARVIRPGGFFRFATDIEDYANWTLAHILRHPGFDWPLERFQDKRPPLSGSETRPQNTLPSASWHIPFAGWQPTRYEAKARREGRAKSFYFTFLRHTDEILT